MAPVQLPDDRVVLLEVRGLEVGRDVMLAVDDGAVEELVRVEDGWCPVHRPSVDEVVVNVALLYEQAGVGDARQVGRGLAQLEALQGIGRELTRALRQVNRGP